MFAAAMAAILPIWRGLFVCLIVALSAAFLASQYHAPVLLFALFLGMSAGFLAEHPANRPGVEFAAGTVLRCGVALLGFRVAIDDLVSLGWDTAAMLAMAACITIAGGVLIAKFLRLGGQFGALSGGAVAICGVSAAVAISSVMPRSKLLDQNLAMTIVAVTVFGSIAMVFFPALVKLAGFSAMDAGIFLGGSIHDVSHVVGAGYSVSPEVGDVAVLTKMIRVAMLIPVVWGFFLFFRAAVPANGSRGKWPVPWFLVAFVAFATMSSIGAAPELVRQLSDSTSRGFLVVAIAALGMKTSLPALLSTGWRPIVLVFGESVLLGVLVLAWCVSA
ncbi:MAG TPA: putative sulfate exporter family transporter [Woeseiaceae bacterium]|nr:putative sulfate exporter family transporter [Woeseiaceae bacterium]